MRVHTELYAIGYSSLKQNGQPTVASLRRGTPLSNTKEWTSDTAWVGLKGTKLSAKSQSKGHRPYGSTYMILLTY